MSEWIPLDLIKMVNPQDTEDRPAGSLLRIIMSPHDVPIAIRGRSIPSKQRFVVEFKYLDDEPTKKVELPDGAIAEIGKHSERLYAFHIPHTKGTVTVEIGEFQEGLQHLMKSPAFDRNEFTDRNLRAAKQAFDIGKESMALGI